MERLTLEQYRRMVEKVIEHKRLNGELPDFAEIDGCRIGKRNYIDMIERVNKFLLKMGRNPGSVDIGTEDLPKMEKIIIHYHDYCPIFSSKCYTHHKS